MQQWDGGEDASTSVQQPLFTASCPVEGCQYTTSTKYRDSIVNNLATHKAVYHAEKTAIVYKGRKTFAYRDRKTGLLVCPCGNFTAKDSQKMKKHAKALHSSDNTPVFKPISDQTQALTHPTNPPSHPSSLTKAVLGDTQQTSGVPSAQSPISRTNHAVSKSSPPSVLPDATKQRISELRKNLEKGISANSSKAHRVPISQAVPHRPATSIQGHPQKPSVGPTGAASSSITSALSSGSATRENGSTLGKRKAGDAASTSRQSKTLRTSEDAWDGVQEFQTRDLFLTSVLKRVNEWRLYKAQKGKNDKSLLNMQYGYAVVKSPEVDTFDAAKDLSQYLYRIGLPMNVAAEHMRGNPAGWVLEHSCVCAGTSLRGLDTGPATCGGKIEVIVSLNLQKVHMGIEGINVILKVIH